MSYVNNFMDNNTDGEISKAASKRIEKAVTWLLYHAKVKYIFDVQLQKRFHFKINFITLTLPSEQIHSDDEIKKKALNNFLDNCRKTHNLKNYIWKAEKQLNGNIHFHLVTDCYIRYDKIQSLWNDSINLLGYVDRFKEKIGHSNPNSTDVHSIKHVKRIANYVAKYMSKNRAFKCIGELREIDGKQIEILYGTDQYRKEEGGKKEGKVLACTIAGPCKPVAGRLWFLSRSLSQCQPIRVEEDFYNFKTLEGIIQTGRLKEISTDWSINYYGNVSTELQKADAELHAKLKQY